MAYERFTLTKNKHTTLRIERLPRGGYVVTQIGAPGDFNPAIAAFSDIDDALGLIKDELEPEKAEEKPSIVTTDVTAKVCAEKLPPLPERPIYRGVV